MATVTTSEFPVSLKATQGFEIWILRWNDKDRLGKRHVIGPGLYIYN